MLLKTFLLALGMFALAGCATALVTGAATQSTREGDSRTADDARLTSHVKTALLRDPITTAFDFSVSANAGTVTLRGVVNGDTARVRAEQVATRTSGVVKVINELVIEP
ncbi:MAG: BON domain-containing protein [Gammaproteobacteria bacterium]